MAINAEQARARTSHGQTTKMAREALEKLAQQRTFDARVEQHAGYAREKLDAAVIKAANDGLDYCAVWFPENPDLMRKVQTAVWDEYTALGYKLEGGPVEESRFNKYEMSLKWGTE